MAPEQQENPHEAVAASDIYALGVSWIQLLSGELPSPHAIVSGKLSFPPRGAEGSGADKKNGRLFSSRAPERNRG